MPPYLVSRDLKARIPVLYGQGYSVKEVCGLLGIKKSLVYKTLNYHRNHGTVYNPAPRPSHRSRKLSQIDINFIRTLIAQHHCIYLDEIQEQLFARRGVDVSIPTLTRVLRRIHFSSKTVSAQALERNDLLRAVYMNKIGTDVLRPDMFMFGDEAAKNEKTYGRTKGWSPVGTRCIQKRCFVRGQRWSILPILTIDGIITYDIIEGSVNSERFLQFLKDFVIPLTNPYPGPRSVLVLDNCSIHHSEEVRELVEDQALCKLIFLPPYSPDYNPIEQAFSSVKAYLRRHWDDTTLCGIGRALQRVTPEMAFGWFRASGYI